jgi:hypothetical protein
VALLVLVLTATAVAGPDAITRALTKPTVKSIAKKQADKRITARAPGLAVASAESANPPAFARVRPDATVDEANSNNVTDANVSLGPVGSYYCFRDLPFDPRGVSATLDRSTNPDLLVTAALGPGTDCPSDTELYVNTRNPDGTGSSAGGFFITIYD